MSDVFHLGLSRDQVGEAELAIIPGDPGRVERIAALLDDPRPLASEREFTSWTGTVGGAPVIVCSTGIGGPSTSIAVEELAQLGVRIFLRVGTTGAIQPGIAPGEVIVTTGRSVSSGTFLASTWPNQANWSRSFSAVRRRK